MALEELGPTFVKLGQLLSTRADIVPPPIAMELEKLQDAVPPFPAEKARAIIESELHKQIGEVFASFSDTPVGSASIAQVHEAVLHDGTRVVLKIRRPGIRRQVDTDLEIMADIARMLERNLPEVALFEPVRIVEEFSKTLHRELDFSIEAAHIERFTRNFAGDARVHVPKGKMVKVTMEIPVERFRYWDTVKKQYTVEPGQYELMLGAASDDIRAHLPLNVVAQAR